MDNLGILVGCDVNLQSLLPWWWKHYSKHNTLPVAFANLGMTEKGINFCKERGMVFPVHPKQQITRKSKLSPKIITSWENYGGKHLFNYRKAWLKKAYALFKSPFQKTIWIDIDCKVQGNLLSLFSLLDKSDIAMTKDFGESLRSLLSKLKDKDPAISLDLQEFMLPRLPEEVIYNSGVIVYRTNVPFFTYFKKSIQEYEPILPGDQDWISRAVYLYNPPIVTLPQLYNWSHYWEENSLVQILHFHGFEGKEKILKDPSFSPL